MRVAILRVGQADGEVLEEVGHRLSEAFPDTDALVLGEALTIPDDAYNPARGQCHSRRILAYIKAHHPMGDVDRILGVTEADLYVPSLNFVFGEALSHGGPAIISLFRLSPEFYGRPPDKGLYIERASKEAVHELGHTLGLGHCRDPRCVMFFSNSILDTDRKSRTFCRDCYIDVLEKVKRLGA